MDWNSIPDYENGDIQRLLRGFSAEIKAEALRIIESTEWKDREEVLSVSLDPYGTKVREDAYFVEELPDGWRFQAHFSDVASFIPSDSPLDLYARKKGKTWNIHGENQHMLPPVLADKFFSLNKETTRPTITVEIEFDKNFTIKKTDIRRTKCKNLETFSYGFGDVLLNNEREHKQADVVKNLHFLAQNLQKKRTNGNGETPFFDLEKGLVMNPLGKVETLPKHIRYESFLIVSELHMWANKAVAEFMTEKNLPFVFRNHVPVVHEDILHFYTMNVKNEIQTHVSEDIFEDKKPYFHSASHGFWGTGFALYTTINKQLRNYPDLLAGQALAQFFEQKTDFSSKFIKTLLVDFHQQEVAMRTENRKALDAKKYARFGTILEENTPLEDIPFRDIFSMLKYAFYNDFLPPHFITEIENRLKNIPKSISDPRLYDSFFYNLLFMIPKNDKWYSVRQIAIESIKNNEHILDLLLKRFAPQRKWTKCEFFEKKHGNEQFTCSITITYKENTAEIGITIPFSSAEKAKAYAFAKLLDTFEDL